MSNCITTLNKDLGFDCSAPAIGGIEFQALLINREDIDWGATTLSDNKITSFVLKNQKTGYFLQGKGKSINLSSKPVISDTGANGFTHSVSFQVTGNSAEDYKEIDKLVKGANLVLIVQRKNRGTNGENTFEVFGLHIGLEVAGDSAGLSVHENDGAFLLSFSTPDGMKEPYSALKWLETDYNTTKAKFDAKLSR